jgi:hypothetical protein
MSNELVWDLVLGDIASVKELSVLTQVCRDWNTEWENVTSFEVLRGMPVHYPASHLIIKVTQVLSFLIERCPHLRKLECHKKDVLFPLPLMRQLPTSITSIDFRNCSSVDDEVVAALSHLSRLQILSLAETSVSAACVHFLPPSVTSLDLSYGRDRMRNLCITSLTNLRTLSIVNARIAHNDLYPQLAQLTNLTGTLGAISTQFGITNSYLQIFACHTSEATTIIGTLFPKYPKKTSKTSHRA